MPVGEPDPSDAHSILRHVTLNSVSGLRFMLGLIGAQRRPEGRCVFQFALCLPCHTGRRFVGGGANRGDGGAPLDVPPYLSGRIHPVRVRPRGLPRRTRESLDRSTSTMATSHRSQASRKTMLTWHTHRFRSEARRGTTSRDGSRSRFIVALHSASDTAARLMATAFGVGRAGDRRLVLTDCAYEHFLRFGRERRDGGSSGLRPGRRGTGRFRMAPEWLR